MVFILALLSFAVIGTAFALFYFTSQEVAIQINLYIFIAFIAVISLISVVGLIANYKRRQWINRNKRELPIKHNVKEKSVIHGDTNI